MTQNKTKWVIATGILLTSVILLIPIFIFYPIQGTQKATSSFIRPVRTHLDHSAYFTEPFQTPQSVTKKCLECHPESARQFMKTSHWTWVGTHEEVIGNHKPMKVGKKNLLNNFCLSITDNWASCTKCHAGYGWKDESFDFSSEENVDCLSCHDWTGSYVKAGAGLPDASVDLQAVAKGVGYPRRDNCGTCHFYGGGGLAVKHGDMDDTLIYGSERDDVHMGKYDLLCVDCHRTQNHNIPGTAYSVSVTSRNGVDCIACHEGTHQDKRINTHIASLACQTCHIPKYAKKIPTKTDWDWSKAGDVSRKDDPHVYLRIKGEFIYGQDLTPEYYWFNMNVDRYLLGDLINPETVTDINKPLGGIDDPNAKIWPFKVHRAIQPYDKKFNYFLPPTTSGKGGYWSDFDWQKALTLGAKASGIPFSGEFGFTQSAMYWPLSHMVGPKENALNCDDCHGENSRMDWNALGYEQDPIDVGGRNFQLKASVERRAQ
ncbi:MAG: tetrathionate reductase family octaheme c-type cytochrome [SAR324 cluster bacterium]|nr:tetrathionate reductase family octaheme c-type cytochrome [SAR324 cluster bacterium]